MSERPTRESNELTLFDMEPDWKDYWWGMPEFSMKDASPIKRITVNFMTQEDVEDFKKTIGQKFTDRTDSLWFPEQKPIKPGTIKYDGPPTQPRYPICILSKGRYDCQTTGKVLDKMGINYKFFVEETEGDLYNQYLGEDKVVVMPFHDLGQGGIPARNFIWEWAKEREFKRHWTVDDNIGGFARTNNNRRPSVYGGGFFNAMEDFSDRYENVVMTGPHNRGFVPDRSDRTTPVLWNSRIYSCILLKTDLPDRWRGKYNEDTDLSLRLLKQGYCTALFRALLMDKGATVGSKGKALKGGNTDNVYNTGDHRRAFAESLREQHPDVVEVVWKFGRWHHQVDYSPFKNNKPVLRADVTPTKNTNEYGMKLVKADQ